MLMMRTQIELDIDEIDDKETTKLNGRPPQLVLREHLLEKGFIVLAQGDHSMTVSFGDLETAIAAFGIGSSRSKYPRPTPGGGTG